MNFFDHQEKARKHTTLLVFYFILAIICIILAFDAVILSALLYANHDHHFITINHSQVIDKDAIIFLSIVIGILCSPIVITVIILGTIFKLIELRGGGDLGCKNGECTTG